MEKTYKPSRRFYIVATISVILLVVFVVGAIVLLRKVTGNVRKMKLTTITCDVDADAVVIRSERVVSQSASDSHILAEEGAAVQQGVTIAELYSYTYESALTELCTQEAALYSQLKSLILTAYSGTMPESVTVYTDAIEQICTQLRAITNGTSTASYSYLEEQLVVHLAARREAMIACLSDLSLVQTAIDQVTALETAFAQNTTRTVTSEYNGYISFYTDGNEETLKDVNALTVSQVKRVLASTSTAVDDDNFNYRIVTDPNVWYVAFVVDDQSDQRLMPLQSYPFTISGIGGSYAGEVIAEKDAASGVMYVLEVHSDVQPVLTARVVKINIQYSVSGTYVPIDYISYTAGVPYVTIKTDKGYQPIAVYIAGSDGKNAIIWARDESVTLHEGVKYRTPDTSGN